MGDPAQDAKILQVMMNDLGLGRMEELATDDTKKNERRLNFAMQSIHSTKPRPQQEMPSQRANKWNTAEFNDEDSRAVKNLDSIEGGRLHALNRTGGGGQERSPHLNEWNVPNQKPSSSYDPKNPQKPRSAARAPFGSGTYSPGPVRSPPVIPAHDSARGSQEVTNPIQGAARGWNQYKPGPKRVVATQTTTTLGNGNKNDAHSAVDMAHEARGASTAGPRSSFAPHTDHPALQGKDQITPAAQSTGIPSVAQSMGSHTAPHLNRGTALTASSAVMPVKLETSVPPHLRNDLPLAGPTPVLPNPVIPRPVSQQAPELFWDTRMKARRDDSRTGESDLFPGKLYVYQYPGRMVAIVEFQWDTGHVMREDIRALLKPTCGGVVVVMRCSDGDPVPLRNTHIKFNNEALAKTFDKMLSFVKSRFSGSSEPWYPYTMEDPGPKGGTQIDVSTLLPLGGVKPSVHATKAAPVAKETPAVTVSIPLNPTAKAEPHSATQGATGSVSKVKKLVVTSSAVGSAKSGPSTLGDSAPRLSTNDDVLADILHDLNEQDRNAAEGVAKEGNAAEDRWQAQEQATNVTESSTANPSTEVPTVSAIQPQQAGLEPSAAAPDLDASDDIAARRAQLESDLAGLDERPVVDVLIDTSSIIPEHRLTPHSHDLEGIVYEPSSHSTALNSVATEALELASEGEESSEPGTESEPSSLVASSEATLEQRTRINAVNLKKQRVGVNLSQLSLKIISDLDRGSYIKLLNSLNYNLYWMEEMGESGPDSTHEKVTAVTTVQHLARQKGFVALDKEDRLKTAAVVFSNLTQLDTRRVITYSVEDLLELRQYARRAPSAVLLVNEYLRATKQIRAPSRGPSATLSRPTPQAMNAPTPAPTPAPTSAPTLKALATSPTPSTSTEVEQKNRPLPPHLRGIGHNAGLGHSRWA